MKKIISITFTLLISICVFCQSNITSQPELDSGTIETKFGYIIENSTTYKNFHLIKRSSILKIKEHVLDTINTLQNSINAANTSILKEEKEKENLKNEVEVLTQENENISKKVDGITFLGFSFIKTTYNVMVWMLIIILLLVAIVLFSLYKKSHTITKNAQTSLGAIENDFEVFKKKALTKEQETMRKLQNELNKNMS